MVAYANKSCSSCYDNAGNMTTLSSGKTAVYDANSPLERSLESLRDYVRETNA
jgi:hypothetical protein